MENRAIGIVLVTSLAVVLSACNPVGFSKFKTEDAKPASADLALEAPPVVTPLPSVPTPPVSDEVGPILTKGTCAADSSTQLLSCMNCVVPQVAAPRQFSEKGEAFFEIMVAACQVRNKSDPRGYVPPTRAELLYRLNRLSPTLYPDTPMTPMQVATIRAMRTDPAAREKYFGGIFYSGVTPETIAFETYFGLETREARYTFCYADEGDSKVGEFWLTFTRTGINDMVSNVQRECIYDRDPWTCRESSPYVNANIYRNQLRNAMTESLYNPYVAPPPGTQTTCHWEKFVGQTGAAATAQVKAWLDSGFKVGADIPNRRMCSQVTGSLDDVGLGIDISMAAYRCR